MQKGLKSAFYFALACAMVELIYSYIAVRMTQAVIDLGGYTFFFEIFSAVLFLGAGVYYIQKKTPQQGEQKLTKSFNQGLMLSIINIVAIPFWLVYTTLLSSHNWINLDSNMGIAFYTIGIPLGTLLSLSTFAVFSYRINQKFTLESHKVNRLMGFLLIATAVAEVVYLFQ